MPNSCRKAGSGPNSTRCNIRPVCKGLWLGMANAALDTYLFMGRAPWTMRHHPDHTNLKKRPRRQDEYPKLDVVSFDRNSSVYLSGTNHEENQLAHLTPGCLGSDRDTWLHDAPEQRYCPAGMRSSAKKTVATRTFRSMQNQKHCRRDIKDPSQNIVWVTPEGGGGPNYPNK